MVLRTMDASVEYDMMRSLQYTTCGNNRGMMIEEDTQKRRSSAMAGATSEEERKQLQQLQASSHRIC